jgi:tetratricopeptide (TPR) repeat protein
VAVAEHDVAVACLRLGNLADARDHFEKGLRLAREAARLDPAQAEQEGQLMFSLIGVAEVRRRLGQSDAARPLFAEALSLQEGEVARHPDRSGAKLALRSVLNVMAIAGLDEPRRSEELFQRAEKVAREILAAQPDRADNSSALASLLLERGLTLRTSDPVAASAKFAECAGIRRRLAAIAGPQDSKTAVSLAFALAANGEIEEASAQARRLHEVVKGDSEALIDLMRCFAYAAAHASGEEREDLCVQSESVLREAVNLHFIDPVSLRYWLGETPVLSRTAVKAILTTMDDQIAKQRGG